MTDIEIVSNETGEILESYKIETHNQYTFLMNAIKKQYLINRTEVREGTIRVVWVQD